MSVSKLYMVFKRQAEAVVAVAFVGASPEEVGYKYGTPPLKVQAPAVSCSRYNQPNMLSQCGQLCCSKGLYVLPFLWSNPMSLPSLIKAKPAIEMCREVCDLCLR